MKIAVAGTGYVGLSLATLLSVKNEVVALDVIPEKVEKINNRISPIQDEYIEKYFEQKELNLTATLDYKEAFTGAKFIIISTPTNYDSEQNYFDTSSVEDIIKKVISMNIDTTIIPIDTQIATGKPKRYLTESIRTLSTKILAIEYNIKYISAILPSVLILFDFIKKIRITKIKTSKILSYKNAGWKNSQSWYGIGLYWGAIYNFQGKSVGRPKASELKKFPHLPIAWASGIPKAQTSASLNAEILCLKLNNHKPNAPPNIAPWIEIPPWRIAIISVGNLK